MIRNVWENQHRRLKRLKTLTPDEWKLLFHALFLVGATRLAIWTVPFGSARRMAERIARCGNAASIHRLVWSVTVASRFVPRATCLIQAISAQALLTHAGHMSSMEIGIRRENPKGFEAHAWVICEDRIVIGGNGVGRYTRLTLDGL
jgi:hypothetical protein